MANPAMIHQGNQAITRTIARRISLKLFAAFVAAVLIAMPQISRAAQGPADRWMEFDLYWFDPARPDASAERFWDRYAPLYRNVAGERGLLISAGMTIDVVMRYSGDDGQKLWLPKGANREIGIAIEGPLLGTEVERQEKWRRRFAGKHAPAGVQASWTYGDLARLTAALRRVGHKHNIRSFRIGILAVAHNNAYGEPSPFAQAHPEAWSRWGAKRDLLDTSAYFDPSNVLESDKHRYAAYATGMLPGTKVSDALGLQWGALTRAAGLDALMLRDSFGLVRPYTRYGPAGETLPDASHAERTTRGVLDLLRALKRAAPNSLTMMYSSAATATADWRGNGFDLERVARAGDLDIFVDQSWSGAWGEVGVRQQTFWNAPILGWTYQLQYFLQHAAVLSGSRVRHYHLVDTFDAWESWDTIHTTPERLQWGIWAMSHAAVKRPDGLKVADGAYVSWGHQGDRLLTDQDVTFLSRELDDAARDARAMTAVEGPTLVYSRSQAAGEVAALAPDATVRDRIDEVIGTASKWSLPVLSVTRAEWLSQVDSERFIFGPTNWLSDDEAGDILRRADMGTPLAFVGDLQTALHPRIATAFGIEKALSPSAQDRRLGATVHDALGVRDVGSSFVSVPPKNGIRFTKASDITVGYAFGASAALAHMRRAKHDIVFWDAPPIYDYWYRPLRDLLGGDTTPYALGAAMLARSTRAASEPRTTRHSTTVLAWTSGRRRTLIADLDDGLADNRTERAMIKLE